MNDSEAGKHTFTGVCIYDENHIYVPAVSDELSEGGVEHAIIFRRLDGQWAHRPLSFAVGSVCALRNSRSVVLCMGVGGEVNLFTSPGRPGEGTEHVDATADGPSELVPLRSMRQIGRKVYVAGMARRVYRRDGSNRWTAIDGGVFAPRGKRERAVGFNAIDGRRGDSIYAVGYRGEIWSYDGRAWTQHDSPTNIALTCVRCMDDETAYAAGLAGVVLRGTNGRWEAVEHDATEDDFWGMAVFRDKLYLACYEGLFVLEGNGIVPVDMGISPQPTTAYLDANDRVVWSVGQRSLAYSEDGISWAEVEKPD